MIGFDEIVVLSRDNDYHMHRELVIAIRHPDGTMSVADPLVWREVKQSELVGTATFGGAYATQFLQSALDCAWKVGLRPDGYQDIPSELDAVRDHLHDMRALVFKDRVSPKT